jgi:PUA domain protein
MAKTKQLNNKEAKEIIAIFNKYNLDLSKYKRFEIVSEKIDILLGDKDPIGLYHNNNCYPSLKLLLNANTNIPSIYLDLGAIPFITKGADLMKPGVKDLEQFEKEQLIIMKDAIHKKPLALGIAEFSSEDIKTMEKGKVVKTLHYIGDIIWNFGNKENK